MPTLKKSFFCQNCGAQSPKWIGKCPSCNEWNTYVEEVISKQEKPSWKDSGRVGNLATSKPRPQPIDEINYEQQPRLITASDEFNRVLGGGIVPGSVVLIGGEPGIGKSTLLLQLALNQANTKVLYVSGEESPQQIKMRADRMNIPSKECLLLSDTSLEYIFQQIKEVQPALLIIDSIQTLSSDKLDASTGSVSQVRECTGELLRYAKESHTPVMLIGHITKEGALAGPKVLEHMVDTVLQFEGDRHSTYRILRTTKNRFGSTSELGIYEMTSAGMKEVRNPSEILLSNHDQQLSGVAIGTSIEGNRPLLIETQALVSPSAYGTPQRSCTGYDMKRLNMLLAVLEKRGGVQLGNKDVFINMAGGLRIEDPALDLAICTAVVSSYEDRPLPNDICFAGEVGLGSEIRAIHKVDQRIAEAEKLGFKEIFISSRNTKGLDQSRYTIKIRPVSDISEVFKYLAN